MGLNLNICINVFYSTFTNIFLIFVKFFYGFNVLNIFLNVFHIYGITLIVEPAEVRDLRIIIVV